MAKKKKYNSRKVQASPIPFAGLIVMADNRRLTDMQQLKVIASARSAFDSAHSSYCPASYNLLGHYYRVCKSIAHAMKTSNFSSICDAARDALNRYYSSEGQGPIPPADALHILRMVDGMSAILPEVPLGIYESAENASRDILVEGIQRQMAEMPVNAFQMALRVARGGKVTDVAAEHGIPEKDAANVVCVVASIAYTIEDDYSVPFPSTIAEVRRRGDKYAPIIERMLSCKANGSLQAVAS